MHLGIKILLFYGRGNFGRGNEALPTSATLKTTLFPTSSTIGRTNDRHFVRPTFCTTYILYDPLIFLIDVAHSVTH